MLLDTTPARIPIIQRVCELEHESLIRLHSDNSVYSPDFAERLAEGGITLDDYLEYASEAYYEFQKVLEAPHTLVHMPPLFFYVFTEVCLYFKEELVNTYGDDFIDFMDDLSNVIDIKPNLFTQN